MKIPMKRKVATLREEAYNLFYPLQGKITLLYRNKDIAPFDDMNIGQFFKGISKVSIIVNDCSTSIVPVNSDGDGRNVTIIGVNKSVIGIPNETSDPNVNISQIINPTVIDNDMSQINMTAIIQQDPNVSISSLVNQRMICFDCKRAFIYFFCRNCNDFICKKCYERIQLPHFNHKVIPVLAENIPKAVNEYQASLYKELKLSKKDYDGFNKQFTVTRDLDNWEKEINGKIDMIEEMSQDIISGARQPNYDIEKEVQGLKDSMTKNINNSQASSIEIFNKLNEVDQYVGTVMKKANNFLSMQDKKKKIDQMINPIDLELDRIIKLLQSE